MSYLIEGVNVVELGTHMAIPLSARMLADWGANVIKVEPPQGEAWRTIARSYGIPYAPDNDPVFQTPNGNKRSIALDLKLEEGREIMLRLLEKTDIFLTNTRMKSLKKLGLDYESLKERFPRLIYIHFNGYGSKGPDKDRPGFDIATYWARAGMPLEWSVQDSTPFRPMPGFGDSTSSPCIVSSALAALYHRQKTKKGDFIEISLYGSALWYNNVGVVATQPRYGFTYPRSRYDQTAPYNMVFRSNDDMFFIFSIPYWNSFSGRFLKRFGLDEYVDDPRFATLEGAQTDMKTVMSVFEDTFRSMSGHEIKEAFKELDVVYEELINPGNVTDDEQAWANDFLVNARMECGENVVLANNPIHFTNADTLPFSLAPQLGADTCSILSDLGYDGETIDRYLQIKAVKKALEGDVYT